MKTSTIKNFTLYISGVIFIIVLWEVLALVIKNDLVIPNISSVFKSLINILKKATRI